jgi:RHS repeat-associated protein
MTSHYGTALQDMVFYPFGGIWLNWGGGGLEYADLPYYDTNLNVDFPEYRVMSNNLGRWHSPDPVPGDPSNPQSWNRYAYVLNNPTNLIDPLGLDPCSTTGPGGGFDCSPEQAAQSNEGDGGGGAIGDTDPTSQDLSGSDLALPFWGVIKSIAQWLNSESNSPDDFWYYFVGPPDTGSATPCHNGYRDATPRETNAILATARSLIKSPYTPGAGANSSPTNGFDCSGFVSYCVNASGISFVYRPANSITSSPSVQLLAPGENPSQGNLMSWPSHVGFYDPNQSPLGALLSARSSLGVQYGNPAWWGKQPPKFLKVRVKCN